jgi:hypothetical protein
LALGVFQKILGSFPDPGFSKTCISILAYESRGVWWGGIRKEIRLVGILLRRLLEFNPQSLELLGLGHEING